MGHMGSIWLILKDLTSLPSKLIPKCKIDEMEKTWYFVWLSNVEVVDAMQVNIFVIFLFKRVMKVRFMKIKLLLGNDFQWLS